MTTFAQETKEALRVSQLSAEKDRVIADLEAKNHLQEKEQEVVEMEISNSLSGHLIREYVNSYLRYAIALKKEGNFNPEKIEKIMDQEVTVTLLSKEEAVSSQYSKEKLGENYF